MDKRKIGELLVILGTVLFVGGAMSYLRGELPAEHIAGIGALALIFVVVGASSKDETTACLSQRAERLIKMPFVSLCIKSRVLSGFLYVTDEDRRRCKEQPENYLYSTPAIC